MLRTALLVLVTLAVSCAAPDKPAPFSLDGLALAPARAADDPVRVGARDTIDRLVLGGLPIELGVVTDLIADGCPEGWVGLFHGAPVLGRERAVLQSDVLDRLADCDPDHGWFADHIARTWIFGEAASEPRASRPLQFRARAAFFERPLARLATEASRSDVRSAAAGALGRLLVEGHLSAPQGAAAVARGVGHLRSALAIWSTGDGPPGVLALRNPRTSEMAAEEMKDLIVAATGRGLGQRLATISVLDDDGRRVGIADALGNRPAVVVVWGFT